MTQAQFKDKLQKLMAIITRLQIEKRWAALGDSYTFKIKSHALSMAEAEFNKLSKRYYKLYLQKC